jgi:hypothetical protein
MGLPGSQNRINRISAPGQLDEDRQAAGQRVQFGPVRTVRGSTPAPLPASSYFPNASTHGSPPGRPTPQVAGSSTPHSPRAAPQPRVDNKIGQGGIAGRGGTLLPSAGVFVSPGPQLICLRGIPFGWSRVVPLAERRPHTSA